MALRESPDFVVVNVSIITMNPTKPAAQELAMRFGRFAAVGSSDDGAATFISR